MIRTSYSVDIAPDPDPGVVAYIIGMSSVGLDFFHLFIDVDVRDRL